MLEMETRLPPLGALHAFVLLAQTGSLSAAAIRLNVTQPAVSKRVRALEAWVGTPLVYRGANALQLTEAGADYAKSIEDAFSAIQVATAGLMTQPSRLLRVRAYTTWALRWLIPRLSQYQKRQPGYEVEVSASLAPVNFARDNVDVAIRVGPEKAPGPAAVRLQQIQLKPFGTPSIAQRMLKDLSGVTLLASRARPNDWGSWARAAGIELSNKPLMFENTGLAIQAALEGLGVVIAAPALVASDVRRGLLMPLSDKVAMTGDYYWYILPPGPTRPEAITFREWLLEEINRDQN